MIVYAHRGASAYAPENTMPAMELAVKMGATGIEIDVHKTKDNVIVVSHDSNLSRCGKMDVEIGEHTFEELLKYDVSNPDVFGDKFKGTKIPAFFDIVKFLKTQNYQGILNIEIKGNEKYDTVEGCIKIAKDLDFKEHIMFSSFDHSNLVHSKKVDPSIKTGLLTWQHDDTPWNAPVSFGCDALHPYYKVVPDEQTKEILNKGLELNPYTIDDPNDMKHLIELGVSGIITNKPDICLEIYNSLK